MTTLRVRILIASIATLLTFVTVFQTACKKDETTEPYVDTACLNVDCNNGECLDGQCGCYVGWEGFYCDIKAIDKFMGKWNAVQTVTLSNVTSNIGDTQMYDFYIMPDGSSLTTFRLAGLNAKPNDTMTVSLASPQSSLYHPLGFRFVSKASNTQGDLFYNAGGGWITSSGSIMDSMAYSRWYGMPGDSTFVVKDSISVAAQKAP